MYKLLNQLQTIKEEIDIAYEENESISIDEAEKLMKIAKDLLNMAKTWKLEKEIDTSDIERYPDY